VVFAIHRNSQTFRFHSRRYALPDLARRFLWGTFDQAFVKASLLRGLSKGEKTYLHVWRILFELITASIRDNLGLCPAIEMSLNCNLCGGSEAPISLERFLPLFED
jgi:hypothetical protein